MSRGHGGARAGAGRPRLSENEVTVKTIRERARDIEAVLETAGLQNDYLALRKVFIRQTRSNVGNKAAKLVIDYAAEEAVAEEALSAIQNRPQKVTHEDALSILLHVDLSRHQYQTLRTLINNASRFRNLLPTYEDVRLYKTTCAPLKDETLYLERRAEVQLQNLLDHTAERAVASNAENIDAAVNRRRGPIECEFLVTWGLDGASQNQQFQQRHQQTENKGKSDDTLIAVVLNPIRLMTKRGICLWEIPSYQSHKFVRPIVLEFEKESEEYVKSMKAYIDLQIHNLQPTEVLLENGRLLRIRYKMLATLIDGKVFCYFMDRPFSSCPVCPADKNDFKHYRRHIGTDKFAANLEACFNGLQPLHARINFANHLVKMPMRIARDEAKEAAAEENLSPAECRRRGKQAYDERFEEIKRQFRQHDLHLGLTITGNMSRTLFGPRRDLLERIIGIDRRLIEKFSIILTCINTNRYKLKPVEFQKYCDKTRNLYLRLYPQYPLTPTIHKVLEHAVDIQNAMGLVLGQVSEGSGEAKHRIRKQVRMNRARKTSRRDNLSDVMDRCLHLSDPKLSMQYSACIKRFRDVRRKHEEIPQAAQDLLEMGDDASPPAVVQATHSATTTNNRDNPEREHDAMDVAEGDAEGQQDLQIGDEGRSGSEVDDSEQSESEDDDLGDNLASDDSSDEEDLYTDE